MTNFPTGKQEPRRAILLLAHGSPDRVEEIPEYLRNITGGRPVPEEVVREVEHRYSLIGRSPLTEITLRQGEAVARQSGLPVYVGMRNWRPYIREAVQRMTADGITQAVVICLAPHNSRTSVGLYRRALFSTVAGEELPFTVDFVESWHDHPLLIAAFAEKLRQGWKRACADFGGPLPVIFTAHSVPVRTISEGDPYERQTRETAALVAAAVPEIFTPAGAKPAPAGGPASPGWRFAFQSQGMSGGEWLGPTVEDTIRALKAEGHAGAFLQPIGFVCDHVEILYDIDIAFRQFAEQNSMRLWRAESLNDSATFTGAVAAVAARRVKAAWEQEPAAQVGESNASGNPGTGRP